MTHGCQGSGGRARRVAAVGTSAWPAPGSGTCGLSLGPRPVPHLSVRIITCPDSRRGQSPEHVCESVVWTGFGGPHEIPQWAAPLLRGSGAVGVGVQMSRESAGRHLGLCTARGFTTGGSCGNTDPPRRGSPAGERCRALCPEPGSASRPQRPDSCSNSTGCLEGKQVWEGQAGPQKPGDGVRSLPHSPLCRLVTRVPGPLELGTHGDSGQRPQGTRTARSWRWDRKVRGPGRVAEGLPE